MKFAVHKTRKKSSSKTLEIPACRDQPFDVPESEDWRTGLAEEQRFRKPFSRHSSSLFRLHSGPLQPRFAQNPNYGWNRPEWAGLGGLEHTMSTMKGDVSNPCAYVPPAERPSIQRFTLTPMDDAMTI